MFESFKLIISHRSWLGTLTAHALKIAGMNLHPCCWCVTHKFATHISIIGRNGVKQKQEEPISKAMQCITAILSNIAVLPCWNHAVKRESLHLNNYAKRLMKGVFAFCHRPRSCSSLVRDKISCSNISRAVLQRITKFYNDIHTDLLYSNTGHDVTNCFRLAAKCN